MSKNSRLVYSTDGGRVKESKSEAVVDKGDGIVRLKRETKGRKGKGVTLVTGLGLEGEALKNLAKQLKQQCGVGGAVKDGVIEVQTDDRDKLKALLEKQGFTVKLAGG
ncbi:stress response translation initiation inhibitor YciH [Pseudomaricurvus sp. HS19]|uniref:stress response translation initiation inhibitor YciH n=1 Tax=Pseudomaricurvus sp. HS19 TaxID=2692626 RepID=UPI00137107E5|nr:stress response translation initiation inhibitor YciH [Pseudomaricurvus sp. HS19]MYM65034.1 stress response translation initiation inhibitor YciH [Pseudomaricurvus sp. HS19]